MRAIAAPLQAKPFQERRRQSIEPESIDEHGLPQIDLEAARSLSLGLDRCDWKNRGRLPPDWRRIRVGDEQMRDFRARCIEQPEIRQAAGGHGPSVGIVLAHGDAR